ncbi:MAG: lytic transglycosylase domain-containing protein [Syntrophaceae bacterium]|nr:lytic transglycosylase domain-containing protein [Syntrophaceae bacterium]
MNLHEPMIRTEHPPHATTYKKKGLFLFRLLCKVFLFTFIFILSFHLPNLIPAFNHREQTIKEILEVLDRHSMDLADVTKAEIAEVIYEEALRHKHDPKFILALIAIESSFQNWSVSEQGAKGLMQIMPYVAESIARELGIEWSGDQILFNPYFNIRIGIYYLSRLLLDFDDIGIALTAYNYGPTYVKGLVQRKEKIPSNYYRKFLTAYQNI